MWSQWELRPSRSFSQNCRKSTLAHFGAWGAGLKPICVYFLTLDWSCSPSGALWHSNVLWKCIWVSQRGSALYYHNDDSVLFSPTSSCPTLSRFLLYFHCPVLYHPILSSPIPALLCHPLTTLSFSCCYSLSQVCWHNLQLLSFIQ